MILLSSALDDLQTFLLTRPGKSTKPLHLPTKAPACFDSQEQWNLYRPVAVYSAGNGFTYCSDCTSERRDAMTKQGRCRFPGTTFSRPNGVIIGRRKK